jgi:mannose-6-phosphate isomerase-like protein (cupin superfamily)
MQDIGGVVAKEDDRYVVKDNLFGNNLVISSTRLHARKQTSGHSHAGQEEVYFFIDGVGTMQLGDCKIKVKPGDIVPIEDGIFHRVHNDSFDNDLYFVCVFDGKRNH